MKRYFKLAWNTVPIIAVAALGWNSLLFMQSFSIALLLFYCGATALIIFDKENP